MSSFKINNLMRERLSLAQLGLLADACGRFAGKPVTGFVSDAAVFRGVLIGVIYGHARKTDDGVFKDGHVIHSSMVLKAWLVDDFSAVQTRNSLYVVTSWHMGSHEDNVGDGNLAPLNPVAFPQLTVH